MIDWFEWPWPGVVFVAILIALPVVAILSGPNVEHEKAIARRDAWYARLMEQCLQDHKEYECIAMRKSWVWQGE